MPKSKRCHRLLACLSVGLAVLAFSGCSANDRLSYANEMDEPAYRQGESLLKTGRKQEALSAFLKVIEKRGDDAPESHLNVGLLYLQHINDPLAAIYHFKKYLALRPNSPQAPLVRQRIDAAIREFARTLPAQPLERQTERIDLLAKIDRLQRENETLKEELAALRSGRPEAPASLPAAESPGITLPDTIPTVHTDAVRRFIPSVAPPIPPQQARSPAAPSRSPKAHVVRQGDTLYGLAQQYYGDRSRWRDIYAANRDVMRSETDLRIGMTVRIP